jgi:hypothetical protein
MDSNNPWADASSQNQGSAQRYYQSAPSQQQIPPQNQQWQQPPAPSQGIRRSDTEQLLVQESDRAEQVEHMQQYEENARQTEDDRVQADLQKQFPGIDSSLIAAIYNERKGNLAEVREMLQELNTT